MKTRAGFTLMELIVAMIIFTAIAGASWALLDAGRGVSAHANYEAARQQAARRALRAIATDLRGAWSAVSSLDTGFVGTSAGSEQLPLDTLTFVSFANHPAAVTPSSGTAEKEMDLARVAWSIDQDTRTEQDGLVRELRKRITESVTVVDPGQYLTEISKDVVGLNFRYYDGGGWVDTWDSALSMTVPKAVEVTIKVRGVWRGVEEIDSFTTRVWLPVAAQAPRKEAQ